MVGLEKIIALLKQMGISEEASKEFAVILEGWSKDQKATLRTEFADRLTAAKKACIDEVETYKESLARGVERFLESKLSAIERAGAKQRAIEESDAANTLKQVRAMLEHINVDEAATNQALQSEKQATAALKKELVESREALAREKAKAQKFSELAEKSLTRQQVLESKLTESHKATLAEAAKAAKAETSIQEVKTVPADKAVSEAKLADLKTPAATPKTTNTKTTDKVAAKVAPKGNSDIDEIAAAIG